MTSDQREEIKSAIRDVDRGDISPENIRHAKELLKIIGRRSYLVFYLKEKIEQHSAWFFSEERAKKALDIVRGKGYRAIIYVD